MDNEAQTGPKQTQFKKRRPTASSSRFGRLHPFLAKIEISWAALANGHINPNSFINSTIFSQSHRPFPISSSPASFSLCDIAEASRVSAILLNFHFPMETPSSTRRVTRSQASHINNIPVSRKTEDSDKALSKSRQRNGKQQDRSVLVDITNDSPIVGLAGGNLKTPSSSIVKQKVKNTPGSGEALLRGQVKNLLQKVEEEAVLSKISLETRPLIQLANSPAGLIAPTPANTPQVSNLSGEASVTQQGTEEFSVSQVVSQCSPESEKDQITRSLLMDFSEKSEISDLSECSSELIYQEVAGGVKDKAITEDDDASVWSMQVNASTHDEDEEEEIAEEEEDEEYYDDNEDEYEDEEFNVDELCEGLNKIPVKNNVVPKFEGKHTRFVYNNDDELVGEEEEEDDDVASPSVLRLKGLPTPKGKHLRFPEEEEEATQDKADL